jgi:flagellar biosynthesis protein
MSERDVPLSLAAALAYDPVGTGAPEVVAIGRGLDARDIVALAREHGIPLREDPELVAALARLEIGSAIPRELYEIVAEVLAFVYRVDAEAASD